MDNGEREGGGRREEKKGEKYYFGKEKQGEVVMVMYRYQSGEDPGWAGVSGPK